MDNNAPTKRQKTPTSVVVTTTTTTKKDDGKRRHNNSSNSSNSSNNNMDNNAPPKRQKTPTSVVVTTTTTTTITPATDKQPAISSFTLTPSKICSSNTNTSIQPSQMMMMMPNNNNNMDTDGDNAISPSVSSPSSTLSPSNIRSSNTNTSIQPRQMMMMMPNNNNNNTDRDGDNTISPSSTLSPSKIRSNKNAVNRGIIAKTYKGNISTTEGLDDTLNELFKEVTKIDGDVDLLEYSKSQKIMLAMDGGMFMDVASHKQRLMHQAETELENNILTSFKKFLMLERCAFIPGDLHLFFHYLAFIYLIFYGNILECVKYASYRFTIGHTTKDIIDSYREHRDLFLLSGRAALYASIEKKQELQQCSLFVKYFLFFRAMLFNARMGNGAFFKKAMPVLFKCFVAVGKDKPHYRYLTAVSIENYKTFFSKWAKMQWLYNRFLKLVDVFVSRDTFCEFYNWLQKKIKVTTEEDFFAVADAAWPLYVIRSNFSSDSLVQQVVRNTIISKNRRGDLAHFYTLFMESSNMDNLWSVIENKYGQNTSTYREPEKVTENRKILSEMGKLTTTAEAEEFIWKGIKKPNESKVILPSINKRIKSRQNDIDFSTDKFKEKLKKYVKLRKFKLREKIKSKKYTLDAYKDYMIRAQGDADRTELQSGVQEKRDFDIHFHNDNTVQAMIEELKIQY